MIAFEIGPWKKIILKLPGLFHLPATGLTGSLPLSPGLTWGEIMFRDPLGLYPGLRFTYLQLLPDPSENPMQPNSFFGSHGYMPVVSLPCPFYSHSLLIFRQKTGGNYKSPSYSTKASSRLSFQSIKVEKKKRLPIWSLFSKSQLWQPHFLEHYYICIIMV